MNGNMRRADSVLLGVACAIAAALLSGCGPAASTESGDIKAGGRVMSPLPNGFYDGADTTIRLYGSGTEQRFSLIHTSLNGRDFCYGEIDWTQWLFIGDQCNFSFSIAETSCDSADGCTLTLTGEDNPISLRRRSPSDPSLDRSYLNWLYHYNIDLSQSDEDGVFVNLYLDNNNDYRDRLFSDFSFWDANGEAGVDIDVNSCPYLVTVTRFRSAFELYVISLSQCDLAPPGRVEGTYR